MAVLKKILFTKQSNLPGAGKGLFTRVDIKKGGRIVEYTGVRKPWKDVRHLDGYNGYLLKLNLTTAIDASHDKGFGRFANDAAGRERHKGLRNNAQYLIYGNRCFIEATRNIHKGEEIFVCYGRAFWKLQEKIMLGKAR